MGQRDDESEDQPSTQRPRGPWIELFGRYHQKDDGWGYGKTSRAGLPAVTFNARPFDLTHPTALTVEEVVRGLSRAVRYAGHTQHAYPVLAHSLLVARSTQLRLRARGWSNGQALPYVRWALLHDLPEAVTGDVTYPLQLLLGPEYKHKLETLQERISWAFWLKNVTDPPPPGWNHRDPLPPVLPDKQIRDEVKIDDLGLLVCERNCRGLFPVPERAEPWNLSPTPSEPIPEEIDRLLAAKYAPLPDLKPATSRAYYDPPIEVVREIFEARSRQAQVLADFDSSMFWRMLENLRGEMILYLLDDWAREILGR